jgi:class 3 adenylate cyclase/tetratricopeptide (TPR) repeat protein
MSGRYGERVRDLLADAAEHGARRDWEAVRALARAALALAPDSSEALGLLRQAEREAPSDGERRQLTVMFCDLVGSTALSQDHDPEVVREVLRGYQAACDAVVRRYEGHIARYIGDGVLAYFGHPTPHEDDARRAVRAGLDVVDALRPVSAGARARFGIDLRVRVAVHTGLVVRAAMGSPDSPDPDAIVGETPNLAARLQERAAPGTVVISDATLDLVRGWFLVAPMGAAELKGIDRPVHAYEVIEEVPSASRVQAQVDLSPFVGRTRELDHLVGVWEAVVAGGHGAVLITGDAGVGKSRLADVIRRRAQLAGSTIAAGCSSYHTATPLYAARRLVEVAVGIDSRHAGRHSLPALWDALDAVGQADALPYLAHLLDLPPEPWCPAPELDGALLRETVLSTLVEWVVASAATAPTMILTEDLQWADPSTLELIGRVVARRVPGLLVVLTARDAASLSSLRADHLPLDRLSDEELRELASRLPEGRSLAAPHLDEIIGRSDGVPLFLEELLRTSMVASGGQVRGSAEVPAALRDMLLARFAAPGVDLRLAQLMATIGHEAPRPLIAAVSGLSADDLDRQLTRLVETGTLVEEVGDPITYRFRHHLLAELAYDTQLQSARVRAHAAVADALLTERPAGVPLDAGALAHHLERGGRPAAAIEALTDAADAALTLGGHTEARELLDHALGLLPQVPDADEQDRLEVEVRLRRGAAAAATLGYAAPDTVADFQACRRIIAASDPDGYLDDDLESGDKSVIGRAWSTAGLWATFILQGRLDDAEDVSLGVLRQLRPEGLHHEYFDANRSLVRFFRGDYTDAIAGSGRALQLAEVLDMPERLPTPSDAVVVTRSHLAFAHVIRCDLAEARDQFDLAVQSAQTRQFPQRPFSLCYVASMRGAAEIATGDLEAAGRSADEVGTLGAQHGFTFWSLVGMLLRGMVDLLAGDASGGDRAESAMGLLRSLDVLVWQPAWLSTVATGYLAQDRPDLAARALDDAVEVAARTGAHYWSAEVSRLRYEAQRAAGIEADVGLLRSAVDQAIRQGATLHELRSRTDLCRVQPESTQLDALARLVGAVGGHGPERELDAARAVLAGRG